MLLTAQTSNKGSAGNVSGPSASLLYGAQNGYTPKIGGVSIDGRIFEEWASNSGLVRTNVIAIPYSTPGFFKEFGPVRARELRKVWINIMSTLPTKISGFNATLTVENDEHQVGASGGLFMQEHTKVSRERSQIVNDYIEREGQPINEFLEFLIRYGIGDEYTQTPAVSTLEGVRAKFKGKVRLQSYYTGSVLYAELDRMNANVVNAYLLVGGRPETAGEIISERDLTAAKEIVRYSVNINGMVDTNNPIKAHAQTVIDNMTIFSTNPERDYVSPINKTDLDLHLVDTNGTDGSSVGFNNGPITTSPNPITKDNLDSAYNKIT